MIVDIRLHKKAKSHCKEMIQILVDCSTNIKEKQEQWLKFDADNQSKLSEHETIWTLFHSAMSSLDLFTDKIDDTVDKLKGVQKSIPKLGKDYQTLEVKINQARADVDKSTKELEHLEEEKKRIDNQMTNNQQRSLKTLVSCVDSQKHSDDLFQHQTSTATNIKNKTKQHQKLLKTFSQRKDQLYAESKIEEINRCKQLKEQSMKFLQSFPIKSDEYNTLSENYNAENDFNNWEKETFPSNTKKLVKSQSIDKKTPEDEDK